MSILLSAMPDANEMTLYVTQNLLQNYGIVAKEIGPYRDNIRFDVLGVKRLTREIRIFEIKSCRSDFVSDNKWQKYLPYCTHFAFVAPRGVISVDELPPEIGMVEIWHEEKTNWSGEPYTQLGHCYKRKCKRLQDKIDDDCYTDLLEAVVMRLMVENNDFKFRNFARFMDEIRKVQGQVGDIAIMLRKVIT